MAIVSSHPNILRLKNACPPMEKRSKGMVGIEPKYIWVAVCNHVQYTIQNMIKQK